MYTVTVLTVGQRTAGIVYRGNDLHTARRIAADWHNRKQTDSTIVAVAVYGGR